MAAGLLSIALLSLFAASPATASDAFSAGGRLAAYLRSVGSVPSSPPAPIIATYIDWRDVNWVHVEQTILAALDGGFNVIILAFQLATGPTDMLLGWVGVDPTIRNATLATVHAKGAVLLLSAGGASEEPYRLDPAVYGAAVGAEVLAAGLDGVDFDLENLAPGFNFGGVDMVDWIVAANAAARKAIGPARLITHAPQGPYFKNDWTAPSGGYSDVWKKAGAGAIDWLHVQFYNQGDACYSTYASAFVASAGANASGCVFPGTSVSEIVATGVPLGALVLGKPLLADDADTGFTPAADLAAWVARAQAELGWAAGVMCWSWEATAGPVWVKTIYPS
jgi:chitinase